MSPFYSDGSNNWEYAILLKRSLIEKGEHKQVIEDMIRTIAGKVEELAKLSLHDDFQLITYGSAGFFYVSGPPPIEMEEAGDE